MDEERKKELEKEVGNLTKIATELTQTVNKERIELDKLKTEKNAFLDLRLQEESLLLDEIRQELTEVRKQVKLNNEYISQEKDKLIQNKNSIEQERRNVAVLKESVKKQQKEFDSLVEKTQKSLCDIDDKKDTIDELKKKAGRELGKLEASKKDLKNQVDRQNLEKAELKAFRGKLIERTEELSDWEKKLKLREKESENKLKMSRKLYDEAQKLIV